MGAKLSLEHDPDQLEALKKGEQEYLAYCDAKPREVWLDLPDDKEELHGLKKLRVLQVGAESGPLAVFLHGGGGLAADWAPIMKHLKIKNRRYWFIERPGHGVSPPFDYLAIKDHIDEHAAAYVEAVREQAGVDKLDIVGNSVGGSMAFLYAKFHKEHVRSFTWIGAPGLFKNQMVPFKFKLLGSWIGTQLMASPPPASMPAQLHLEDHQQTKEGIPDCYVELYRAIMSLRNNSLSWNYLLRAYFGNKSLWYDLSTLNQVLAPDIKCSFLVGKSEPFLLNQNWRLLKSNSGRQQFFLVKVMFRGMTIRHPLARR